MSDLLQNVTQVRKSLQKKRLLRNKELSLNFTPLSSLFETDRSKTEKNQRLKPPSYERSQQSDSIASPLPPKRFEFRDSLMSPARLRSYKLDATNLLISRVKRFLNKHFLIWKKNVEVLRSEESNIFHRKAWRLKVCVGRLESKQREIIKPKHMAGKIVRKSQDNHINKLISKITGSVDVESDEEMPTIKADIRLKPSMSTGDNYAQSPIRRDTNPYSPRRRDKLPLSPEKKEIKASSTERKEIIANFSGRKDIKLISPERKANKTYFKRKNESVINEKAARKLIEWFMKILKRKKFEEFQAILADSQKSQSKIEANEKEDSVNYEDNLLNDDNELSESNLSESKVLDIKSNKPQENMSISIEKTSSLVNISSERPSIPDEFSIDNQSNRENLEGALKNIKDFISDKRAQKLTNQASFTEFSSSEPIFESATAIILKPASKQPLPESLPKSLTTSLKSLIKNIKKDLKHRISSCFTFWRSTTRKQKGSQEMSILSSVTIHNMLLNIINYRTKIFFSTYNIALIKYQQFNEGWFKDIAKAVTRLSLCIRGFKLKPFVLWKSSTIQNKLRKVLIKKNIRKIERSVKRLIFIEFREFFTQTLIYVKRKRYAIRIFDMHFLHALNEKFNEFYRKTKLITRIIVKRQVVRGNEWNIMQSPPKRFSFKFLCFALNRLSSNVLFHQNSLKKNTIFKWRLVCANAKKLQNIRIRYDRELNHTILCTTILKILNMTIISSLRFSFVKILKN